MSERYDGHSPEYIALCVVREVLAGVSNRAEQIAEQELGGFEPSPPARDCEIVADRIEELVDYLGAKVEEF